MVGRACPRASTGRRTTGGTTCGIRPTPARLTLARPTPAAPDDGASDGGDGGDWDAWRDDVGPDDEPELVPSRWPALIAPVVILLFVLTFVGQAIPDFSSFFNRVLGHYGIGGSAERAAANPNFVSGWADWNYSGYQQKASYPEYQDVVATMTHVGKQDGCGRAMWEYEPEEDRFGTPMALMLLPMWTNECIGSEEGLFFESSATVPYHFLDQSELSQNPSRAMRRRCRTAATTSSTASSTCSCSASATTWRSRPRPRPRRKTLTTGPNPMLTLVAQTGVHQVSYTQGGTRPSNPATGRSTRSPTAPRWPACRTSRR